MHIKLISMPIFRWNLKWSRGISRKFYLHLDADTSSNSLHKALLDLGHDVTCTPTEWMLLGK